MSLFDYAMKRIGSLTHATITCPICGHHAPQLTTKIHRKQTMLCPECKSLFVCDTAK
ncbi:YnfU family zinc-binding protein [Dickeya chrysanthemi]|uniref:YnfU family zinc-binding protein n=1 Tax=Dickeya chrysanthemi TaxID=556 RepID=A0ABU8JR45_DICCH|nr:YnfU family zinc-binding protein [Dickeya chrysanthemi]MCA7005778.1 YnfU family zinc-binding protein [Dickeya chrysanthemi]